MAGHNGTGMDAAVQAVLTDDPDFLRDLVAHVVQEILETEMTAHLGAASYERTAARTGQRNGYTPRQLQTRVGTLTLLVGHSCWRLPFAVRSGIIGECIRITSREEPAHAPPAERPAPSPDR